VVESRYVLFGLIAGAIAGIAQGIYTAIRYIPKVDEVIRESIAMIKNLYGLDISSFEGIIRLAIYISPLIIVIMMLIIGALLGALYEFISKKYGIKVGLFITSLVIMLILVIPNIAVHSYEKALENLVGSMTYIIALSLLTAKYYRSLIRS